MLISLITAWIATICVALTAVKFFTKKNKNVNRFFRKIHIPLGIILIASGLVHGLFAGNALGTPITEAFIGDILFSWNMGTICLIIGVLLALTYVFRRQLKKFWMYSHRVLTVAIVAVLVIHICLVGITLPSAIVATAESGNTKDTTSLSDDDVTKFTETDTTKESSRTKETETATKPTESEKATESLVTFSGATLEDGTYEGSAQGYQSTITVSVTVKSGEVTDIEIVSENDTPRYFDRAEDVVDTILEDQSLVIDAVSGATYSSVGIRDAVYDALSDAVIKGELEINEIQASGKHKH